MRLEVLEALRFAMDQSLAVVDQYLALNRSSITLVLIENNGVDLYGEGGTKTRTDTRITLGDGYVATLSLDGYINPNLSEVSQKDVFLSDGKLQDQDYKLGPIVYPYTHCGKSGGFDLNSFLPTLEENTDKQLYFYIVNFKFPNGSYFKKLFIEGESSISYQVFLRNIGTNLMDIL